ncbi:hypothetical protein E2C01_015549 [Portunus trituberculatus]|uniref:Uncharacterized protein n=1 Tax=Portunus trituberculatus TaxID=210409 RepID=A0A5B7DLV0_PORTR|nr:hypothetical protein [Portunus trituberculatus]
MSSSSDDAETVVALLLAYRKSQQKRKCLAIMYYNSFLGSQMCSFSLTNSNISISGDHIFKAYPLMSRYK